jgi:hypothetical protein
MTNIGYTTVKTDQLQQHLRSQNPFFMLPSYSILYSNCLLSQFLWPSPPHTTQNANSSLQIFANLVQPPMSDPSVVGHSPICFMHWLALLKHEALSSKDGIVPQNLPRDTTHVSPGATPGEIHDGSRYQCWIGSFMHVPTVTAVRNC